MIRADRAGEKRFAELAERTVRTGAAQKTGFLTPAELSEAEICARQAGVRLESYGGVQDAERRVAVFTADDVEEWPIACLEVRWHARFGSLSHRDILGAALALGFDREKMGDILIGEGVAHVFVVEELASYFEANWTRAGNVPVTVRRAEALPPATENPGQEMRATVHSLRLDALVGTAFRLSRGKAQEAIARGIVQVDYQVELKPDRQIAEGALISIRGMGRAKLSEIGGRTKKDRISVMLSRY